MHVCIIGIGLIGGSIGKALKCTGYCSTISVVDRSADSLASVARSGIANHMVRSVDEIVERPDLVIVAIPVGQYQPVLETLAAWMRSGTVVTDVGSTKMSVVHDLQAVLDDSTAARFVPGHPIAGSECSGFESSRADLFENRRVILTPLQHTDRQALELVRRMWEGLGACVEEMDPLHHDAVLAATSHLPHALAFALVHCLSERNEKEEIFRYAAGGFADFTRIASSNPLLWTEICLANRDALEKAIEDFISELQILQSGLKTGDASLIEAHFSAAKRARDHYCDLNGITNKESGQQ